MSQRLIALRGYEVRGFALTHLTSEYEFKLAPDGLHCLYYTVEYDGLDAEEEETPESFKNKAITVDWKRDQVAIHAWRIAAGPPSVYFTYRYRKIRQIILEGFETRSIEDKSTALEFLQTKLPPEFRCDALGGLGLEDEYIALIEEIEDACGATKLIVSRNRTSEFIEQEETLVLAERDFREACRQIDSLRHISWNLMYSKQQTAVFNLFAPFLARQDRRPSRKKDDTKSKIKAIFEEASSQSPSQQVQFADLVSNAAATLIEESPAEIEIVKERIDLAFLDAFIRRFEQRLREGLLEADWQQFFIDNPIALSMLFHSAVVMISDRPHVGGTDLEGKGGKKSDFLYQNALTGNLSFVEIKTPDKLLVRKDDKYSSGMFPAHSDLSLAVSQVLNQRNKFQDEYLVHHLNNPEKRLKSFAIRCFVVIGKVPDEEEQKRSFEHVRDNFKHVSVVTFDEVLSRLTFLRDLLAKATIAHA